MSSNPLVWQPTQTQSSQISAFQKHFEEALNKKFKNYEEFCDASIQHFEIFWKLWLQSLDLGIEGNVDLVRNSSHKEFFKNRFFPALKLNYAESLISKMPEQGPVMVGLTENPEDRREWTKSQILEGVAFLQAKLIQKGITKGDRVAALVPNTPETVIAMLAVTALGAIWSSCSPDFGDQGVLDRFEQIDPKFLFKTESVLYNGKIFDLDSKNKKIEETLSSIEGAYSLNNLWNDLKEQSPVEFAVQKVKYDRLAFDHPLFVMFSSGTTGKPKCIVHGAGGTLLQHLKEHKLHCDLRPQEKILYYTTCGWMMWNWVVSALGAGAILYTYDGSPAAPEADSLWKIVDQEKINVFGTSAKFIASCRTQELAVQQKYKLAHTRLVLSTGSPLLPEDFDYFYKDVAPKVQLASISGGTDIISCFMLGNPLKPVLRGEIQGRGLAMDIAALNSQGQRVRNEQGELVCGTPFPSMPVSFWNDENFERYRKAYFEEYEGYWHHGDYITLTDEGGVIVYGRSDATLNPGGVRIGTAEIYRQVETHPLVADSLAVGRKKNDDEEVLLFLKFKNLEQELDEEIVKEIKKKIREGASPRHVPAQIFAVPDIPYTVSGKKVEIAVKRILQGQDPGNREALSNPDCLDFFKRFS
jgi:acetoacetyl-CoA synthetase